jgi:hypothetical protein
MGFSDAGGLQDRDRGRPRPEREGWKYEGARVAAESVANPRAAAVALAAQLEVCPLGGHGLGNSRRRLLADGLS